MGDLYAQVAGFVQDHGLLAPGAVVVGVSGGPDSLCLLHLLRRLAPELRLTLHAAHLNHKLRGEAADADAQFVADVARAWGLRCAIQTADVRALAARAGLSVEEAGRQARYAFLAETARQVGAPTIAVGHNADDQAETVLMHFLRGSGLAGLRGMLPQMPLSDYRLEEEDGLPAGWTGELSLVRPLLATPRAAILQYCAEQGLAPRLDLSNEDTTYFRNRLRHELLPLLEGYNPGIRSALAHTAAVAAGDYEVLAAAEQDAWRAVARESGPQHVCFDLPAWRALPLGLQRAMLRSGIRRLRRSLRNINWEHVERAVRLARSGNTGQSATLAAGLALEIGYQQLCLGPENDPLPPGEEMPLVEQLIALPAPGERLLPGGWRVEVRRLARADLPPDFAAIPAPWVAWLDAGVVGQELTLRPRRPGDRFQPQGMGGHSTRLHEFMIDAKVPRALRDRWPLLEGASGLAWVCGLRIDERVRVRPETQAVWMVRFERA